MIHYYYRYCLLLIFFVCHSGFTAPGLSAKSYWQCTTRDITKHQWTSQNVYQKSAMNIALESCKKQSDQPASCKTSFASCELYNKSLSTKPVWKCTALDMDAQAWQSNAHLNKDDAALAAKDYCKQKSSIPATCYINMVTCMNGGAYQ